MVIATSIVDRSVRCLTNRQWLLRGYPQALVGPDDFVFCEQPVPDLQPGEALIRTLYFSFDPSQRGWLNDAPGGYVAPVQIGEVMRAGGIGQVVESRHPEFQHGDFVQGTMSWQDYLIVSADTQRNMVEPLHTVSADVPLTHYLSIYGITGVTAYFGMLEIGKVKAGDTVVVSGAAGATGSVAGQIARLRGAHVIGIAGGEQKCRWLMEQANFDAVIDYRSERISKRLRELAPQGVDLFFDNVGGETLDAVLLNLALGARIVICGGIAGGYGTKMPPGPRHYMQLVFKSARMEGFLILTYQPRFAEAIADLKIWVQAGKIRFAEDIVAGIEHAPATLRRLFEGGNLGKQLLKVADPPFPPNA